MRLTLSGVAIAAVLGGVTQGLVLLDPVAFEAMRTWNAGSIAGRSGDVVWAIVPFVLAGLVVAMAIARPLNAVALGDDLARSLGADVGRVRVAGVIAVTLLCGAATAAAGPIGFVGLMVPHIARWIVGPDQRWIFAYTRDPGHRCWCCRPTCSAEWSSARRDAGGHRDGAGGGAGADPAGAAQGRRAACER